MEVIREEMVLIRDRGLAMSCRTEITANSADIISEDLIEASEDVVVTLSHQVTSNINRRHFLTKRNVVVER